MFRDQFTKSWEITKIYDKDAERLEKGGLQDGDAAGKDGTGGALPLTADIKKEALDIDEASSNGAGTKADGAKADGAQADGAARKAGAKAKPAAKPAAAKVGKEGEGSTSGDAPKEVSKTKRGKEETVLSMANKIKGNYLTAIAQADNMSMSIKVDASWDFAKPLCAPFEEAKKALVDQMEKNPFARAFFYNPPATLKKMFVPEELNKQAQKLNLKFPSLIDKLEDEMLVLANMEKGKREALAAKKSAS